MGLKDCFKFTKFEINDFDIATVETLHDLLLEKGYKKDFVTLENARKLTEKMYKIKEKHNE